MTKHEIREAVWDDLESSGVARFPFPPHGRIPNFAGADEAAQRLAATDVWESASALKANPDAPQLPVRRAALHAGKTVYMSVPRLREAACFLRLEPTRLDDIDHAATVGGSADAGEPVRPEALDSIELIVVGSVAVDRRGGRIGKGEGYSDLEYAILAETGVLASDPTVATTVHDRQLRAGPLPAAPHDVSLDLVCTPTETVEIDKRRPRPAGINWDLLTAADVEAMPVLDRLQR